MRKRVVVEGRVQGVFFRETCRREAAARQVGGSVQNRPDGTVEAVFEGSPEAVEEMVRWCRSGPRHATVTGIDVRAEEPEGERSFRLLGET